MDRGPTEGVGTVEVSSKDFPSIQAVHSQDAMVADLLQQAAEAGGVVEGQAGIVLEQGSYLIWHELIQSPYLGIAQSRSNF